MFKNLRSDREGLTLEEVENLNAAGRGDALELEELENARDGRGDTTDSSSSSSDEEMFSTNLEVTELMILIFVL